MRTRIKICGVTRPDDARLACELGADAIGVVLVPASRRAVSLAGARRVRDAVRGLTPLVALLVDPDAEHVRDVLATVRPDLLQFHGAESPEFCASFAWPWMKALSHAEFRARFEAYAAARALVVDSHAPGQLGGTGRAFDWSSLPGDIERSLLLAGGLHPGNVAAAIRAVRPYGVDVASGVERAPGEKDSALLEKFFEEVRNVDRHAQQD